MEFSLTFEQKRWIFILAQFNMTITIKRITEFIMKIMAKK